ncbi:MAG: dienelactone hydrolase family protein [Caulobacterales bacterium]
MEADELEDLVALLAPLLRSLEVLGFIARHLNPPDFQAVMEAAGEPDSDLRSVRARLDGWPERLAGLRERLQRASDEALAAFAGLRSAQDLRDIFRALGHPARAQEALYPLAADLPPVNRFFLEPARRDDTALQERLADAEAAEDTGVHHEGGEPGARGGFSLYVPEYYSPDRAWPLVMALHGGSGNGRAFLWSWLRDARSHGAILVAPTASGETWALSGHDTDTPNLARILDYVRDRWRIDPARLLLTGMSDGGTFAYVSGLEPGSPFTHLAPVAASFHPVIAQMADPERIAGLPIFLTHGVQDWMFPVDVARQARQALTAAGADVTYRELEDLSHCYPREINPQILAWLGER